MAEDTTVVVVVGTVAQKLVDQFVGKLPAWLQPAVSAYGPAVARMVMAMGAQDFQAFLQAATGGDAAAVLLQVRANMTTLELSTEKQSLAMLADRMAQDSYAARALANQVSQTILTAALQVGLQMALAAV